MVAQDLWGLTNGRLSVKSLGSDDFPNAPGISEGARVLTSQVNATDLSRGLSKTLFATAKYDQFSVLGSVFLDGTSVTATDGSRLSTVASVNFKGEIAAIISGEYLSKIKPLIDQAKGETIYFKQAPDFIHVFSLNFSAVIRLTGGVYPRYQELFPDEIETTFQFDRAAMLAALKVLKINLDSRTNLIKIDPNTGEVTNVADTVTVPFVVMGQAKPFAINFKYFKEALESLTVEQVATHMMGTLKPLVFQQDNYRHLLMPVQAK